MLSKLYLDGELVQGEWSLWGQEDGRKKSDLYLDNAPAIKVWAKIGWIRRNKKVADDVFEHEFEIVIMCYRKRPK